MADALKIPDEAETRARCGAFAWTAERQYAMDIVFGECDR